MSTRKARPARARWQTSLTAHADQLEQQANAARLIAMAETPLDGIAVAWDLAMATAHNEAARNAHTLGEPAPRPPAPVSKLLASFAESLRAKLVAVGAQLCVHERERLCAIAPGVLASIEAYDKPVIETIAELISLPPEWAALWLRGHLDEIEARFAP